MSTDSARELTRDLMEGRISRWEFLTRAIAVGLSAGTVASILVDSAEPVDAAEAEAMKGQIVITIISNPPKAAQGALDAAYRTRRPNVKIIWETRHTDPASYTSFLGTQLASGHIRPDIVSGNYQPNFRGYVNLDMYRKAINPHTGHAWDQDLNWDFFRGTNTQGQRIMLATQAVHINWFYNKRLFAKAKVDRPPKTWSEFVDVCAKLNKAGITPVASNYDYMVPQWFAEVYFEQYHVNWVKTARAHSGDWNYDPELDGKFKFDPNDPNIHNKYTYSPQRFYRAVRDGKLRFDTPEVAEIVKNMAAIFPKYATKDFLVLEDPYTPFLQQQVAIMSNGSWSLPILRNDLASLGPARLKELGIKAGSVKPFAWGTFENPAMEGPLVQSRVRSVESASGEYVSIVSKNQQQTNLAVDFSMFWLSKTGYRPYLNAFEKSGQFSAAGPLEVHGVSYTPDLQKLFAQVRFMGNAEASYNGEWTTFGGSDTQKDVRGLLQNALQGSITPKQYAKQLQAYVMKNFDRILKNVGLTKADIENPARQPGT